MDLKNRKCKACDGETRPLSPDAAQVFRKQVPKWKIRKDVLVLPIEAVITERENSHVTLISPGSGRRETVQRTVTLGARNDRDVQITSGLAQDEKVCIRPPAVSAVKL